MNNIFEASLCLSKDRADFIYHYLTDRAITVTRKNDNFGCIIEFTIESNFDLLQLVHAGIHCGQKTFNNGTNV